MPEEELEELPAAPVNLNKVPTAELKNIPMASNSAASVTKELLGREKMVLLKINSTEKDKKAQFVGINGHTYLIPRDKYVKVPVSVVAALEEAKITEYHVKSDPSGNADGAEVTSSEVSRFGISTKPVEEPAPVGKPQGK